MPPGSVKEDQPSPERRKGDVFVTPPYPVASPHLASPGEEIDQANSPGIEAELLDSQIAASGQSTPTDPGGSKSRSRLQGLNSTSSSCVGTQAGGSRIIGLIKGSVLGKTGAVAQDLPSYAWAEKTKRKGARAPAAPSQSQALSGPSPSPKVVARSAPSGSAGNAASRSFGSSTEEGVQQLIRRAVDANAKVSRPIQGASTVRASGGSGKIPGASLRPSMSGAATPVTTAQSKGSTGSITPGAATGSGSRSPAQNSPTKEKTTSSPKAESNSPPPLPQQGSRSAKEDLDADEPSPPPAGLLVEEHLLAAGSEEAVQEELEAAEAKPPEEGGHTNVIWPGKAHQEQPQAIYLPTQGQHPANAAAAAAAAIAAVTCSVGSSAFPSELPETETTEDPSAAALPQGAGSQQTDQMALPGLWTPLGLTKNEVGSIIAPHTWHYISPPEGTLKDPSPVPKEAWPEGLATRPESLVHSAPAHPGWTQAPKASLAQVNGAVVESQPRPLDRAGKIRLIEELVARLATKFSKSQDRSRSVEEALESEKRNGRALQVTIEVMQRQLHVLQQQHLVWAQYLPPAAYEVDPNQIPADPVARSAEPVPDVQEAVAT